MRFFVNLEIWFIFIVGGLTIQIVQTIKGFSQVQLVTWFLQPEQEIEDIP